MTSAIAELLFSPSIKSRLEGARLTSREKLVGPAGLKKAAACPLPRIRDLTDVESQLADWHKDKS